MRTIIRWLLLLGGGDGLRATARALAAEGGEALAERAELAALEWRQVRQRALLLLAGGILLAMALMITLLLGSLALMIHFWDTPLRVTVAWSVALGWLALCLATAGWLAYLARRAPSAFALTREELARDWALIKESL
ncbi:MAG: phage holin family protein [Hydrogenophaga sp.]|jgi:uncharacterized membrane protein YqjE|uniref:phage holin family protein n=1 Tax=Hydrogenophaga sp. TaxID=1904254 RepID=UPI000EDE33CD|nr:phage holin family protein [Hydrogenophaga sp.]MDD3785259.1 phage holin family protein [Hydrogenophaga sp.]MDX9967631.1 phage holin family protein [Hydrogenophaga sp.]HAJ12897.1 hypothetical protein [Comamonadaceae bacterium]